jgi:predicted transcriptional regulator
MTVNRAIVLHTLIKHETLTIGDIAKEENLGLVPNHEHLGFLLEELIESGHIGMLDGVLPNTYTITAKGIKEGARLTEAGAAIDETQA